MVQRLSHDKKEEEEEEEEEKQEPTGNWSREFVHGVWRGQFFAHVEEIPSIADAEYGFCTGPHAFFFV